MCATVIMSFFGSPPHLWVDMLGEGSPSLNHHLIHWPAHQSYSTQMVDHQWRPPYVFGFPGCLVGAVRWSC